MGDPTPPASSPTRRLVGLGVLGAATAVLAGCGIRLEDDAPRVPLVPTRQPIPGEESLLRLVGAVRAASLAPVDTSAPVSPVLPPLHRRQADVLRDALRQRGVPEAALPSPTPTVSASTSASTTASEPVPSGTPSRSPGASPSPTVSPSPTGPPALPAELRLPAVEGSILAAAEGCSEAEPVLRPPLVALLAQANAATELATGSRAEAPTTARTWSAPELLVPLVEAARRATYLLEVAAARTPVKGQRAARDGIARLEALTAEIVEAAGDAAPVPELGYPLPQPVTTPAQAAAFATQTRATLLGTFGAHLGALTAADPAAAFADLPRWLGSVAAEAHRGGTPLTAFPGLT